MSTPFHHTSVQLFSHAPNAMDDFRTRRRRSSSYSQDASPNSSRSDQTSASTMSSFFQNISHHRADLSDSRSSLSSQSSEQVEMTPRHVRESQDHTTPNPLLHTDKSLLRSIHVKSLCFVHYLFPFLTRKDQTLYSFVFNLIPKQFKLTAQLEYEYEKGTIFHDRIMRIAFLLIFPVTYTILDIFTLSHGTHPSVVAYYIVAGLQWLGVLFLIICTFLFPRNLLWQRFLSIVSISLMILASFYSPKDSLTYRELIVTSISFMAFPYSSFILLFLYGAVICAFPMVCVMLDIHPYFILQMWFVLVAMVVCSLTSLFCVQKKSRAAFLSRHSLKLRKAELRKEADRTQFLINQMLPQQLVKTLQEDIEDTSVSQKSPHLLPFNPPRASILRLGKDLSHHRNLPQSPSIATAEMQVTESLFGTKHDIHHRMSKYQRSCEATIAFVRIRNFKSIARSTTASDAIIMLSELYSLFDESIDAHALYRFKTIGPVYMFGGGATFSCQKKHLNAVFQASQQIITSLRDCRHNLSVTIGIASGTVVCGIIGNFSSRIHFDVWGNAVTLASRLSTYQSSTEDSINGSYIQVESDLVSKFDLHHCVLEEEQDIMLKGQQNPVQLLRIFPPAKEHSKRPASVRKSSSTPQKLDDILKTINSGTSSLKKHLRNILLGEEDGVREDSVSPQRIEMYISDTNTASIEKAVDELPENLANIGEEVPFWYWVPLLFIMPLVNLKFYHLFLKSSYRSRVSPARGLIFQSIVLYCLGGIGNYCAMVLYADRDKLGVLHHFLESVEAFSHITPHSIALWRYGIGLPLIVVTSFWVWTPLYSRHWFTYNIFSFLSTFGILLAHGITCHHLGSTLQDQFTLLAMLVSFCYIQLFSGICKMILLAFASCIFVAQNILAYSIFDVRYQVSAGLLLVSVVALCIHNSILTHTKVFEHFLSTAIQVQETQQLEKKKEVGNMLAGSLLPSTLVNRLEVNRQEFIGEYVESLSVCFADIVNFSQWSASLTAEELVKHLDHIFCKFSMLALRRSLNRLQILGDNFVCIGGCPNRLSDHQHQMVLYAFDILDFVREYGEVEFRVGINCGPAISGCLSTSRLQWDVFGPTMTIGELMEQTGEAMKVHVSHYVYLALGNQKNLHFEKRPSAIDSARLENPMQTFFVSRTNEKRKRMKQRFISQRDVRSEQGGSYESLPGLLLTSPGVEEICADSEVGSLEVDEEWGNTP